MPSLPADVPCPMEIGAWARILMEWFLPKLHPKIFGGVPKRDSADATWEAQADIEEALLHRARYVCRQPGRKPRRAVTVGYPRSSSTYPSRRGKKRSRLMQAYVNNGRYPDAYYEVNAPSIPKKAGEKHPLKQRILARCIFGYV